LLFSEAGAGYARRTVKATSRFGGTDFSDHHGSPSTTISALSWMLMTRLDGVGMLLRRHYNPGSFVTTKAFTGQTQPSAADSGSRLGP